MMMIQAPMTMMAPPKRERAGFLTLVFILAAASRLPFYFFLRGKRHEMEKFSLSSDGWASARADSFFIEGFARRAFLFLCSLGPPSSFCRGDSYLTFLVWIAFRLLLHSVAQTQPAETSEHMETRMEFFFPISPIVMRCLGLGYEHERQKHEIHHICSVQIDAVTRPMLFPSSSRRIQNIHWRQLLHAKR